MYLHQDIPLQCKVGRPFQKNCTIELCSGGVEVSRDELRLNFLIIGIDKSTLTRL